MLITIEFKVKYHFQTPEIILMQRLSESQLKIPGNWGKVDFDGVIFQTYALYLNFPSYHKLTG